MKRLQSLVARARSLSPRTVDAAVAAVLVIVAEVGVATLRHPRPVSAVIAAVTCATVVWRRRAPAAMTLLAAITITVYVRTGGNTNSTVEPVAVLLDYYMLGRVPRRQIWIDGGLLAIAIPAIALTPGTTRVIDIVGTWALFVVGPFAAGRAIASRSALTAELRANADRLQREQQERARRAAAEERNRIARELHDVVAHSVSVMVIQTQAARRVVASDRQAARQALGAVEDCGRDALAELRRMMGAVRHGDTDLAGAAAPGLSQLGALVDRARASGLPVELRVQGSPYELAAGLDLVAYRVVQEALTNTIKHAGPARSRVIVTYGHEALELEISDSGQGPPRDLSGSGHGLIGMHERVALFGGELWTGRRRHGGFEVRARIPMLELVAA